MWIHRYLSKHLKPGEEPIQIIRRFWVTFLPSLLGGGLLFVLDFFLLAWWLQWRGRGLLGFLLVALVAAIWIARSLYIWSRNVLVLTNQRIIDIDQHGLWQRTVAEAPYAKIQDVRYTTRGMAQTIFRYGTVIIQTAGNTTNLEMDGVHDPMALQQMIVDIQSRTDQRPPAAKPEAVAEALQALRTTLDQTAQPPAEERQHDA